jgi:hypothetical protein
MNQETKQAIHDSVKEFRSELQEIADRIQESYNEIDEYIHEEIIASIKADGLPFACNDESTDSILYDDWAKPFVAELHKKIPFQRIFVEPIPKPVLEASKHN